MSFTTIPTTQISASQPTSQDLFTLIKNNFDDHESRIANSSGNNGLLPPVCFEFLGYPDAATVATGIMNYRLTSNVTLLACRLLVVTAGSSGTLTVDVQYKRGAGAWTTILTGAISAASSGGSLNVVSGALAVTSLLTGDFLRLNVSAVQSAMKDFSVYVEVQGA